MATGAELTPGGWRAGDRGSAISAWPDAGRAGRTGGPVTAASASNRAVSAAAWLNPCAAARPLQPVRLTWVAGIPRNRTARRVTAREPLRISYPERLPADAHGMSARRDIGEAPGKPAGSPGLASAAGAGGQRPRWAATW